MTARLDPKEKRRRRKKREEKGFKTTWKQIIFRLLNEQNIKMKLKMVSDNFTRQQVCESLMLAYINNDPAAMRIVKNFVATPDGTRITRQFNTFIDVSYETERIYEMMEDASPLSDVEQYAEELGFDFGKSS